MRKIKTINRLIKPLGIEITKTNNTDITRRLRLIEHFNINKILDVGANIGNYAIEMRELGFKGKIISFEPLIETYKKLKLNSAKDKDWTTMNVALGDENEMSEINVAGNVDSSSILDMLPSHIESAPQTKYVGKERIKIITLDSIFSNYSEKSDNIYMKIDTQGFEKKVLLGSLNSLDRIIGIQIEMSLIPLYKNSPSFIDIIEYLTKFGYKLLSIENGFSNPKTGQLLQIDGIFYRKKTDV